MLKKFALSMTACAGALVISSCSSSDRNADGAIGAPTSMAGTSFSFNPTVELTDGTNFSYTNTEIGSTLPAGPVNGIYNFTRDSDTQVTITLNGPDIGGAGVDILDLILTNFSGSPSAITSFDVTVDGATFIATVVSGVVLPGPTDDGDEGGGGGGGGTEGGIPDDPEATPATIDPGFVGTHVLTFFEANAGGPFADGEEVTFEITAAGELKFQGRTLTGAFFYLGNQLEVIWFDGTNGFAASGSGSLNEINISNGYDFRAGGFTFLGQFGND